MPGDISDLSSLALSCSPGTPSSRPLSRVLSQVSRFRLANHAARWTRKTNGLSAGPSQRLCMHFTGAARWCHVVIEQLRAAHLALCLPCAVPHPHPVPRRRLPAAGPCVVLPSHWSLLRWVQPTSSQLSASAFNQCWWSGGHQEESEVRGGPQPSPLPAYPVLGQRVNWEAQVTGSGLCPQGHPRAGPRP